MKAQAVIDKLKALLPFLTDAFTSSFSISSITASGTTATVTSAAPHGLVTNDLVTIEGAIVDLPLSIISRDGTVATAGS